MMKKKIDNKKLDSPESHGYETAATAHSELIAQGIAAYLSHPNSFKQLAPNAAAMIRKYVNEHPELSKHIQFTALEPSNALA